MDGHAHRPIIRLILVHLHCSQPAEYINRSPARIFAIFNLRGGITNICEWPLEILRLVIGHLEDDPSSVLKFALVCRYIRVRTLAFIVTHSVGQAGVKSFYLAKVISLLGQWRNNDRLAYLNKHGKLKLRGASCVMNALKSNTDY